MVRHTGLNSTEEEETVEHILVQRKKYDTEETNYKKSEKTNGNI